MRRPGRRPPPGAGARVLVALAAVGLLAAACGHADRDATGPTGSEAVAVGTSAPTSAAASSTTTSATDTTTTTTAPAVPPTPTPTPGRTPGPAATAPPAPPPSDPRVALVSAADLGASWHPGCPVGPSGLRRVAVTFVGFDGAEHAGALVVNADAASATLRAFDRLRAARFPIRSVLTVDRFGASDDASMAADNTSAFNCRPTTGSTTTWSQHAYGRAIDVNPIENPYLSGSSVQPPAGAAYRDRAAVRPGMAEPGGDLVAAFAAVGWGWGGTWHSPIDYQHFSATGR